MKRDHCSEGVTIGKGRQTKSQLVSHTWPDLLRCIFSNQPGAQSTASYWDGMLIVLIIAKSSICRALVPAAVSLRQSWKRGAITRGGPDCVFPDMLE